MEEIKKYTITDADGNSIPEIQITCKCVITELVNNHKDKKSLIDALKHHLNTNLRNSTHNFDINILNNKGDNLYSMDVIINKPQIINKIDMILPNAT